MRELATWTNVVWNLESNFFSPVRLPVPDDVRGERVPPGELALDQEVVAPLVEPTPTDVDVAAPVVPIMALIIPGAPLIQF